MARGDNVEQSELMMRLEEAFTGTFIRELLPGIIHNFANPLNGIMGRAQIMEKRFAGMVNTLEVNHPQVAEEMASVIEKLRRDMASITRETDRFFDLFRDVSDMMSVVQNPTVVPIQLSNLGNLVVRFFDHYLDFKHGVVKEVVWDDLPEIKGNVRLFSLGLWSLLRYAQKRMGGEKGGQLKLTGNVRTDAVELHLSFSVASPTVSDEQLFQDVKQLFEASGIGVLRDIQDGREAIVLTFPLHGDETLR